MVKIGEDGLEFVAERGPRMIFDRMVAWFVRHNTPVPLRLTSFKQGLGAAICCSDGMIFLPEQGYRV